VWAINIGHFNDPAHGGSWIKVGDWYELKYQCPESFCNQNKILSLLSCTIQKILYISV
jgi:hypothetical protein